MSQFSARLQEFPVLETPRLTLRQLEVDDASAYLEQIAALPQTSTWSTSYEAQSVENCRRAIQSYDRTFRKGKTVIPWALVDRQDRLVGFVKLFHIQHRSKGEIGYWLGQSHWGQGLMTEAALCVVRFAFADLNMHRIYATTKHNNVASQRVLERVGFQREGVLRQDALRAGEWTDSFVYGILNTDRIPETT